MARLAAGAVAAATLIGAVLRLWALDARPIHHDEAVNWFLFHGVARSGVYDYDPSNFHGPLHFHLGACAQLLLGEDLISLRLPTALAGAALVPLPWLLRRRLGILGAVAAAWLLACSPTLVYYARDAIHETWLVGFTLTALIALVRWWDAPTARESHLAAWALGLSIGGLVATKETAVITFAGGAAGAGLAALMTGIRPRAPAADLARAAAGAAIVVVLLYTSFLRSPADLVDLASTLKLWGERGVEGAGHDKPAGYFVGLLVRYEALSTALACLGAAWSVRNRHGLGLGLAGLAMTQLAVYSAIPYKTPWLILNLTLPLAILGGLGLRALTELPRSLGVAACLLLVPAGWRTAVDAPRLSLVDHDRQDEPLVYVQTHRELVEIMDLALAIDAASPEPARLRSFYEERYPMNWFLWRNGLSEEAAEPPPEEADGDLVLVDPADEAVIVPRMHGPYWRREVEFRNGLRIVVLVAPAHEALLGDLTRWTLLSPADQ